ncbi:TlpA family protein disulfide reductase [bacterium]|nr:TlpA family protein disulfide reductase [bacterium]
MRRILTVLLIACLAFTVVSAQTSTIRDVYKLLQEEKFEKALELTNTLLGSDAENDRLLSVQQYSLEQLGRTDEAKVVAKLRLTIVEASITENGENRRNLGTKQAVLVSLERYDEAIVVALKVDELREKSSPWTAMGIADIYIAKKDKENAFKWVDEAVNRGFNGYDYFKEDQYALLQEDSPRVDAIVKRIKEEVIGIGKPSKDFTVKLLDGSDYQLSAQKGKVVLVDFWATWCGPCVQEMPNVKAVYDANKDKGFEIIGISLDRKDGLQTLKDYIKENELDWKFSFTGGYWQDVTAKAWGVNSIPSVWLIDKKGMLRYFGLHGEEIKTAVEILLAE